MNRATSYNIDMVVVIIVLALTSPFIFKVFRELSSDGFGGFGTQIEKTAMKTSAEIIPQKRTLNRDDIMLMFVVADKYVQEPKIYDIDGTTINIDTTFLSNRTIALMSAYSAMPANVAKKITLYLGPIGPRFWKIENE